MGLFRKVARRVASRLHPQEGPAATTVVSAAVAPLEEAEELATIECGAQELKERVDAGERVLVVDVRARLDGGTVPGAVHLPLAQLDARWQELAQADEIVCTCADGSDALAAAHLLRARGLINATRMEGGLQAWKRVGGRLE